MILLFCLTQTAPNGAKRFLLIDYGRLAFMCRRSERKIAKKFVNLRVQCIRWYADQLLLAE